MPEIRLPESVSSFCLLAWPGMVMGEGTFCYHAGMYWFYMINQLYHN